MVQSPFKLTVEEWLQQDAETLLARIEQPTPIDPTIGLSLADGLTLRVDDLLAQQAHQASLQWAMVTLRLYDRLLQNASPALQDTLFTKAMMLRIRLMQTLGLQTNHPVLDPQVVKQWFQQTCEFSLAETETMAQDWRNLPVDQIRHLRQLKNRLRVMVQLSQIPQVRSHYPDLEPWLNLQPQLP